MTQGSYKQFCPVAMAAEILCSRWTIVLLRELIAGSTRFNDLRRGVPRMSPALLSQRLKDLEAAGVLTRVEAEPGVHEYVLTAAGRELEPLVHAFGMWGHRWIESKLSLQHLDARLLMWDMRRSLDATPGPKARSVIQFQYADAPPSHRLFWLIAVPDGEIDLCEIDPGFDVDLYVSCSLLTMTAIWLGYETPGAAVSAKRLILVGNRDLQSKFPIWLGLRPFANMERRPGQIGVSQ
jgi:DNA-binding HxlR family transcriptional regulator